MSDLYDYNRSLSTQDMDHVTPFSRKNWNYIADTNNGSYTNGAQTLVQFDGSSIYNAGNYIDGSDLYLSVPLVRVAAFSNGATPPVVQAPTTATFPTAATVAAGTVGNEFSTVLKTGYWNLVQSLEVVCNGKTVIQQTPNINFYNNFKLLSQMSPSDVASYGASLGIAEIDSVDGYKFYGSGYQGTCGGNGLCNNNMFPVLNNVPTSNAGLANDGVQSVISPIGTNCYNKGLLTRAMQSGWGVSSVAASKLFPNIYGDSATLSLFGTTQITNEAKNYFTISSNYMIWYDTAIIRLKDICNFFDALPLVKQLSVLLRVYFNTGQCGVTMGGSGAASNPAAALVVAGKTTMAGINTTFANTCPIIIPNNANLSTTSAPADTRQFVAGLFIQKATNGNMLGINLGASGASHTISTCRLYFSMVSLKPELAVSYATANRAKKILYKNVLSQNITNIATNATWSQLVQSGVTRITGVLLIPFLSASTHGNVTQANWVNAGTPGAAEVVGGFSPACSPFDTAPVTTPMSLTQLQVQIGGVNELMNYYSYTYENFLQQVSTYDKLTSTDLGINCGLISQKMWEQGYRYYFIDCSRYTNATALEPRNVTVSFLNNSLQSIDVSVFVEYLSEVTIDCETGLIIS